MPLLKSGGAFVPPWVSGSAAGSATLDLVVVSGGGGKLRALFLDIVISVTIQIIQLFFFLFELILLVVTGIKRRFNS